MTERAPETIFEMSIETLRERTALARDGVERMRALLSPLFAQARTGMAGGEDGGEEEPDSAEALARFREELAELNELLPGMALLSPERRQYLRATTPSPEVLQKIFEKLPKPPRLTDSAPTALDRAYERAVLAFERSELLRTVEEPLAEMLGELAAVLDHLRLRIARALGQEPPAEPLN